MAPGSNSRITTIGLDADDTLWHNAFYIVPSIFEVEAPLQSEKEMHPLVMAGKEMLAHPIELLPGVAATLEALAREYRLVLVTKGDLLDQERKLAQSGLGDLFTAVEIVSEKTTWCYQSIFAQHGDGAEKAVMVGNSLRSDVLPVIDAGAHGVHVPHGITWALEEAEPPHGHPRFHELDGIRPLPDLLRRIEE